MHCEPKVWRSSLDNPWIVHVLSRFANPFWFFSWARAWIRGFLFRPPNWGDWISYDSIEGPGQALKSWNFRSPFLSPQLATFVFYNGSPFWLCPFAGHAWVYHYNSIHDVGILLCFWGKALAFEPVDFFLHCCQYVYNLRCLVALSVSPGDFPLGKDWEKVISHFWFPNL